MTKREREQKERTRENERESTREKEKWRESERERDRGAGGGGGGGGGVQGGGGGEEEGDRDKSTGGGTPREHAASGAGRGAAAGGAPWYPLWKYMIMLPRHCVVVVVPVTRGGSAPPDVEEEGGRDDPPQNGTSPKVPTGHMDSQWAQSDIHIDRHMALRAKSGSGQRAGELASLHKSHSGISGISWHRFVTSCMAVAVGTRFRMPGTEHCLTTVVLELHSAT